MKKILTAIIVTFVLAIPSMAQTAKSLELSFDYVEQSGPGSNQYAVWVENSKGKVGNIALKSTLTQKDGKHDGVITNVKAILK